MQKYFAADVWERQHDCPNTNKYAKPVQYERVKNQRVALIKNGTYRNAAVNGYFALADAELKTAKGMGVVEVYCLWFGLRLKTRGIHVKCGIKDLEIIESYSGEVVFGLGRQPTV